jgi:hypothetical protein
MLRMNWPGTSEPSSDPRMGTANPLVRLTQEQSFHAARFNTSLDARWKRHSSNCYSDAQLRFSRTILRNYGNMSSPTVMFVLEEVVRSRDPRPGDWGVMIVLGPGMAAEVALLRW